MQWALEVDHVAAAWCYPIAQGLGTVDVVILANEDTTGNEIPSSSARIGAVTSVSSYELVDSGATFTTGHAVAAGDVVENPLRETSTTVVSVDDADTLTLADDIFPFAGDPYIVHCQCGTSTSVSSGKLVDSAGAFTDATYTVHAGDAVENLASRATTTVVSVDDANTLTLAADIFTAADTPYAVRGLVARVKSHIDPLRPVTASKVRVIAPTTTTQAVTMTVTGSGVDPSAIAAEIEAEMNRLIPDQTLYVAKLIQIAMDSGAENAAVTVPATDVTPSTYQMIRPGVIDVT
ncbi:MAG: hypothetical protein APR55_06675 [Methanolinea sp. SDB]|nr:MAG: hypothetical protein APR55_06675 [Methanolinea sp. SDB]